MTIEFLNDLKEQIEKNNLHKFYTSRRWVNLRRQVLTEYKSECQICKTKGKYEKATHVHHVQFVKKHPHLALSRTYEYDGQTYNNLLPVCHNCHEEYCHPERHRKKKEVVTIERWD